MKIQECPLVCNYTAHERRMMLISRLPNIIVLNGGDKISPQEREDAERAFIRYFLYQQDNNEEKCEDTVREERPPRVDELIEVHGLLEPLANIDLSPEIFVSVKIKFKDQELQKQISVRQSVRSFKKHIEQMYSVSPNSMRVFYYDQGRLSKY